MGLSIGGRDKCNTWDRPSDNRDDTCAIVFTTLCVSMTCVHIAKTTQTHKYIPSKSLEQGYKHDTTINMPKTTVGSTSEKEARHVEETHGITSRACKHACY